MTLYELTHSQANNILTIKNDDWQDSMQQVEVGY